MSKYTKKTSIELCNSLLSLQIMIIIMIALAYIILQLIVFLLICKSNVKNIFVFIRLASNIILDLRAAL